MRFEPTFKNQELFERMLQEWVDAPHPDTPFIDWVTEKYPQKLNEIQALLAQVDEYKRSRFR